MANFKLIIVTTLWSVCTMISGDAPRQQFIQFTYTGISEGGAPWILFMTTKSVDTALIDDRLKSLKIEIDSQQASQNNLSASELKMRVWHSLFRVMVTNESTFSETAHFIEKNKDMYTDSYHTCSTVTINTRQYPISKKREEEFFRSLITNLVAKRCDTLVIGMFKRYADYRFGK